MDHIERILHDFRKMTKEQPLVVRSPGRVNLIGEHTDYNLGFVLPAAIDRAITFAVTPRTDQRFVFEAADMDQRTEIDWNHLRPDPLGWPNYLIGVLDQLNKMGISVGGVNCVFGGNVPIGAGLSSSAALEAGFAFALNELYDLRLDKLTLVKLSQKAENEFVGVQCGIMDQFINIFGETDTVLRIDCRTLDYTRVPMPHDVAIVLFNTQVSHSLASSEYNVRRRECTEGVRIVAQLHPGIASLRDVTLPVLKENRNRMNSTIYRRCSYVVSENDRLLRGCELLAENDIASFGSLMFETHDGLSADYGVSCPELDALVRIVRGHEGIFGARMMGGGFGGCTINLVRPDAVDAVVLDVQREFQRLYGRIPPAYVTKVAAGTHCLHEASRAKV